MSSLSLSTSEWIQFFKEAGIPPGPAVNYAVMFVDNRIQKNMLMDLTKEIMNELGITIVGDIIAILKHAKVVYRQEMCKAATESVSSNPMSMQSELRRNANTAATRMIANSLSRDSPPSTPVRRPDTSTSKISVTVSNKMAVKNAGQCASRADESLTAPVKRRRVTAEMEGKYIINMPKGTTPRTKKILEQQAAKGQQRTSVFDRLGAETKADTTTGNKPTGVFSRLGDTLEGEEDKAAESDDDCSVLQYAGVLKKPSSKAASHKESAKPGVTIKAKATSSEAKPAVAATTIRRLGNKHATGTGVAAKERKASSVSKVSVVQRLGTASLAAAAQDSSVTSSKSKPKFRVTIKRTLGSSKVSSTSEVPSAQMDNTGTVSVFKRLGRKTI
uniref:Chromosome 19 open reading frame 47 n=1 Tax=Sphenodon punctatus TaxID=8508 RepID=A0A8D0HMI4_SPHPU